MSTGLVTTQRAQNSKYVYRLSNETKFFTLNTTHKVNARSSVYKIEASMIAKCMRRELSKSHRTDGKLAQGLTKTCVEVNILSFFIPVTSYSHDLDQNGNGFTYNFYVLHSLVFRFLIIIIITMTIMEI